MISIFCQDLHRDLLIKTDALKKIRGKTSLLQENKENTPHNRKKLREMIVK